MTQIPEWANWVARDKGGSIWAYENKPEKYRIAEYWGAEKVGGRSALLSDKRSFPAISWEDEEPTKFLRKGRYDELPIFLLEQVQASKAHGFDEPPTLEEIYGNANMNGGPSVPLQTIEKPKHYQNKTGKDLFQKWYEEHDLSTFRAIMRATAERYTTRYEHKNGIEDLEKGIETLRRLKEYEMEESAD